MKLEKHHEYWINSASAPVSILLNMLPISFVLWKLLPEGEVGVPWLATVCENVLHVDMASCALIVRWTAHHTSPGASRIYSVSRLYAVGLSLKEDEIAALWSLYWGMCAASFRNGFDDRTSQCMRVKEWLKKRVLKRRRANDMTTEMCCLNFYRRWEAEQNSRAHWFPLYDLHGPFVRRDRKSVV